MVEDSSKENAAALIKNQQKSRWRWFFTMLRLLFFTGIMISTAFFVLPPEDYSILTNSWIIGGGAVAVILFGAMLYYLNAPENPLASSLIDFEAIGVVAISAIIIIFLGVLTLIISSEKSTALVLGLVFTGIYTFYIYRTLRELLTMRREHEELRRRYGELIEVDKEKSDFITVTSHQLRTPLTEIRWALEAVQNGTNGNGRITNIIQKSILSVNQLVKIIDDMVKAQVFESINNSLETQTVDVALLIQNIIEERDLLTQEKEVAISFSPPEQKIFIAANRDKIKIALENIIDNAIRYSPRGNVYISLNKEGDRVRIRVQDTGIGIIKEDYGRIFTKFFRGKNAVLTQPNGSGIGLYASRNIVQRHGGTIDFLSEEKKGTSFILTLPLAKEEIKTSLSTTLRNKQ